MATWFWPHQFRIRILCPSGLRQMSYSSIQGLATRLAIENAFITLHLAYLLYKWTTVVEWLLQTFALIQKKLRSMWQYYMWFSVASRTCVIFFPEFQSLNNYIFSDARIQFKLIYQRDEIQFCSVVSIYLAASFNLSFSYFTYVLLTLFSKYSVQLISQFLLRHNV